MIQMECGLQNTRERNLGFFFSGIARNAPDRLALIDLWNGSERRVTYSQLDSRANQVAAMLAAKGLQPGDRLGLLIGNRIEFIEVFFGSMRAGIVPVPLNIKQPPASLTFMVEDAGCRGVVVDPDSVSWSETFLGDLNVSVCLTLGDADDRCAAYEQALRDAGERFEPSTSPDGIAFQPYTAGSTGRPKGVRLTHEGMLWSLRTTQDMWPTATEAVGLVAVPLFHKNAMRGTIKPVLNVGATAVILPRFEPRSFLEALARYRVTFSGGVPAIFTQLLEHRDLLDSLHFSALEALSIGSAVVPQELISNLERVFPRVKVKESYGLTEGGGPLREPVGGGSVPPGSCGVAAPGYDVALVDGDGLRDVTEGELWTRNPCVTAGYHNLPDVTREKIVDGWLRTGDVFRRDADGFFYFLGRVDDMFSCGGENIYPREVENLLLQHPAVRDVSVAPVPHPVKGFVPAAVVVATNRSAVTPEDLKAFTLANGPAYAHPRRIILADELPLSGAGKPDRAAIRRILAAAFQDSEAERSP